MPNSTEVVTVSASLVTTETCFAHSLRVNDLQSYQALDLASSGTVSPDYVLALSRCDIQVNSVSVGSLDCPGNVKCVSASFATPVNLHGANVTVASAVVDDTVVVRDDLTVHGVQHPRPALNRVRLLPNFARKINIRNPLENRGYSTTPAFATLNDGQTLALEDVVMAGHDRVSTMTVAPGSRFVLVPPQPVAELPSRIWIRHFLDAPRLSNDQPSAPLFGSKHRRVLLQYSLTLDATGNEDHDPNVYFYGPGDMVSLVDAGAGYMPAGNRLTIATPDSGNAASAPYSGSGLLTDTEARVDIAAWTCPEGNHLDVDVTFTAIGMGIVSASFTKEAVDAANGIPVAFGVSFDTEPDEISSTYVQANSQALPTSDMNLEWKRINELLLGVDPLFDQTGTWDDAVVKEFSEAPAHVRMKCDQLLGETLNKNTAVRILLFIDGDLYDVQNEVPIQYENGHLWFAVKLNQVPRYELQPQYNAVALVHDETDIVLSILVASLSLDNNILAVGSPVSRNLSLRVGFLNDDDPTRLCTYHLADDNEDNSWFTLTPSGKLQTKFAVTMFTQSVFNLVVVCTHVTKSPVASTLSFPLQLRVN
eukprot:TRINITY_DN5592_c0_g1_i2.p1 TRINITY_DN5592_c0_g1~~TRINITY_DN5592_c0_g1_i2.p1  ORF type:complete len:592 (+),score=48.21 TRINITY_DN5592_c0_g1_i2:1636-3411(+)